jgi:hypothetical protein
VQASGAVEAGALRLFTPSRVSGGMLLELECGLPVSIGAVVAMISIDALLPF